MITETILDSFYDRDEATMVYLVERQPGAAAPWYVIFYENDPRNVIGFNQEASARQCYSLLACGTFGYCREHNMNPRLTPTREHFISTYEAMLRHEPGYEWTRDEVRFSKFMASVRSTLERDYNSWSIDSPVVTKAWRAIGMTGKPTYKGLRALPVGHLEAAS